MCILCNKERGNQHEEPVVFVSEGAYYAIFGGTEFFYFIYLPISNKNTIFAPGIRNILSYDVKL